MANYSTWSTPFCLAIHGFVALCRAKMDTFGAICCASFVASLTITPRQYVSREQIPHPFVDTMPNALAGSALWIWANSSAVGSVFTAPYRTTSRHKKNTLIFVSCHRVVGGVPIPSRLLRSGPPWPSQSTSTTQRMSLPDEICCRLCYNTVETQQQQQIKTRSCQSYLESRQYTHSFKDQVLELLDLSDFHETWGSEWGKFIGWLIYTRSFDWLI
jgi:hypothetical protein